MGNHRYEMHAQQSLFFILLAHAKIPLLSGGSSFGKKTCLLQAVLVFSFRPTSTFSVERFTMIFFMNDHHQKLHVTVFTTSRHWGSQT
jgi:hypothetical protein